MIRIETVTVFTLNVFEGFGVLGSNKGLAITEDVAGDAILAPLVTGFDQTGEGIGMGRALPKLGLLDVAHGASRGGQVLALVGKFWQL